jgi:hypothetical protein
MSKKYVPTFLKDQQGSAAPANSNSSFWPGQNTTNNQFAALSEDFTMNKKEKPIVNTSLPAREAPKLAPATLASLTSGGSGAAGGSKKSFGSKFAEQARAAEDPNYKPPPKPVDFSSTDDFPTLGGPKKPSSVVVQPKPVVEAKPTGAYADMAKSWAKQKEEAEEMARQKAAREARRKAEEEQLRRVMPSIRLRRRAEEYNSEDEEYQDRPYDESSLGDSDSYEMPEDDQEPSEEEENEDEFNNDIGYDGRRRGDLY